MSSDKSHVSMEQHMCPACGCEFDTGAILLRKDLRQVLERHTLTGMSLCPDCQKKYDDGYVAIVAVTEDRKRRTGRVAWLAERAFNEIISGIPSRRADGSLVPVMHAGDDVLDKLEALATHEQDPHD